MRRGLRGFEVLRIDGEKAVRGYEVIADGGCVLG